MPKKPSFGPYPEVGLLDAREKRLAARKKLVVGIDPGHQKRIQKLLAIHSDANTFEAVWAFPSARMKMQREHRIPLPRQAVLILQDLHSCTGHANLVFPGLQSPHRPLGENTMIVALRHLEFSPEEMTSHGFRATASILFNESGRWSPDVIEKAPAHQDKGPIRRANLHGECWQERITMARRWADYLDELRDS